MEIEKVGTRTAPADVLGRFRALELRVVTMPARALETGRARVGGQPR